MTIKGFDFYLTESGTQEAWQNSGSKDGTERQAYIVFCDGVSPTDTDRPGTSSQAAATLAEQALRHYLDRAENGTISEEALHRAFAYANRRVLELYGDEESAVAVSAVIMAIVEETDSNGTRSERLLVAGVGDSRVYAAQTGTTPSVETIFADPQTPQVDHTMTAEDRCLALHNALGVGDLLSVHIRYYEPEVFERYLLASYGFEQLYSASEVAQMATRPHDTENGVAARLNTQSLGPHIIRVCTASYEAPVQPLMEPTQTSNATATSVSVAPSNRSRERFLALALSAVTCALVIFVALEMVDDDGATASIATQEESPLETHEQAPVVEVESTEDSQVTDQSWVTALKEQLSMQEGRIADLMAQIAEEQSTNALLEKEIAAKTDGERLEVLRGLKSQLAEKDRQIHELRLEHETLARHLNQRAAESKKKLELTNQQLKGDFEEIQARLEKQSNDYAALQESYRQETTKVRGLQSELHRMAEALSQKEELLASAKETSVNYANRYEELESRFANKMDEFTAAFEQEQERHAEEKTSMQSDLAEMASKFENAQRQTVQLSADLQELMKQGNDQRANSAFAKAEEQWEQQIAALEKRLSEERKRNTVLKEELGAALEKSEEMVAARNAKPKVSKELKDLREQLTRATESKAALEEQVQRLTAELNRRPDQDATKAEFAARMEDLNSEMLAEQERNEVLKSELQQALTALESTQAELRALQNDHSSEDLAEALMEEEQKSRLLKAELNKLLAAAADRDETNRQTTSELSVALDRTKQLENERVRLLDEKASLMDKVSAMERFQELYTSEKRLREKKEREFAEFADSLGQQQQLLNEVQASRQQLAAELARIRKEYQTLMNRQSEMAKAAIPEQFSGQAIASRDDARKAAQASAKVHIVSRGETLSGIAMRYLGSASRWNDIYEANAERIADPRRLKVGMALVIPQY